MLTKKKEKTHKIFLKLFLSYSAVLLAPVLLFLLVNGITIRRITEQTVQNHYNSVLSSSSLIKNYIDDIKTIAESTLYDIEIQSFLNNQDFSEYKIYYLYEVKNSLIKFQRFSNVANICLISGTNGYFLTPGGAAPLNDLFFQVLSYLNMSYSEWLDFSSGNPVNDFYVFPGENPNLIYLMNIRSSISNPASYLVIQANTSILAENFSQITEKTKGISFLLNSINDLIYTNHGFNETLALIRAGTGKSGENRYLPNYLTIETTDDNGWKLVSLVPDSIITNESLSFSRQMLLIAVLFLFSGLVICYFLTMNKARILMRIVAHINNSLNRKPSETGNPYAFIEKGVETIVKTSEDFQSQNIEQKHKFRHELFLKLLKGDYNPGDSINAMLEETGFMPALYKYAVILADNEMNIDINHGIISGLCKNFSDKTLIDVWIIQNFIVVLCIVNAEETSENWISVSKNIIKKTEGILNGKFFYYVSDLHDNPEEIKTAHDETILLMQYQRIYKEKNINVLTYNQFEWPQTEVLFNYPMDFELQLMHAIKTGDLQKLNSTFSNIYRMNFIERHLPVSMIRQLISTLRGTIIRCMDAENSINNAEAIIKALYSEDTIEGIWENILLTSKHLCNILQIHQTMEYDRQKEKISEFLSVNYVNSTLTLYDMSLYMNIPERTLYELIKKYFNSTFAKMLEIIRIQKSCELIRTNILSIKEIAGKVGYTSDNTFRIAFKRVMKMTPGDYLLSV